MSNDKKHVEEHEIAPVEIPAVLTRYIKVVILESGYISTHFEENKEAAIRAGEYLDEIKKRKLFKVTLPIYE